MKISSFANFASLYWVLYYRMTFPLDIVVMTFYYRDSRYLDCSIGVLLTDRWTHYQWKSMKIHYLVNPHFRRYQHMLRSRWAARKRHFLLRGWKHASVLHRKELIIRSTRNMPILGHPASRPNAAPYRTLALNGCWSSSDAKTLIFSQSCAEAVLNPSVFSKCSMSWSLTSRIQTNASSG